MFCYTLLYVHSCIAIILMGKRELVALLNLSAWCLVMVERLFLGMPRGCLRFVIVVFPDYTHLLFLTNDNTDKACRTDEIPSDVLKNDMAIAFIHVLMNVCFTSGSVPAELSKGIIHPSPKSKTADMGDPLQHNSFYFYVQVV